MASPFAFTGFEAGVRFPCGPTAISVYSRAPDLSSFSTTGAAGVDTAVCFISPPHRVSTSVGYGGGGLPYPTEVLTLWGGEMKQTGMVTPAAPVVLKDDGSGAREYTLVAVGPQGKRTPASKPTKANGLATLRWDSVTGADAYAVLRDGKEVAGPLRIEGSRKEWTDKAK